jgi:hypothetical protein
MSAMAQQYALGERLRDGSIAPRAVILGSAIKPPGSQN